MHAGQLIVLMVVDVYQGVNRGELSRELNPGVVNWGEGGVEGEDVTVENGSIV